VYIIEDINDKRSSTNITNANKYLSSKYIKMTTIYRYEVGNHVDRTSMTTSIYLDGMFEPI
jgi:hypothetical protein